MILRFLDRLEEYLTAALLAAMTLVTFVQVVLRYVFDTGLIWALEATTYLFGWLVLMGIAFGIRTRSHIAVDLLSQRLSPAARKAVALVAAAACLTYAGLMCYGSWTLVAQLHAFGSLAHDIPLPRWMLLASLPIGFALLGLRLAQAALELFRGTRDGVGPSSEASDTGARPGS
jgi:C4-dicarboxylate transporter, DctQ subunit